MTRVRIFSATAILFGLAACDVPTVPQTPLQLRATPAPVSKPIQPVAAKPVALRVAQSDVGGLAEAGGQVSASDADTDADTDTDDGDSSGGVSAGGGGSIGGSDGANAPGIGSGGSDGLGGSGTANW